MEADLGAIVDGPSAEDLGQSLVFTNSLHNGRTATHSYAHATANSYAHAASANTTYAHAALVQSTTHTHISQLPTNTYVYISKQSCGGNLFSSIVASHPPSPLSWVLGLGL